NPQVPYGNSLLPNLATISNCEYWILTRDAGTSTRLVTLYFDANSCGFQNIPANLLVANYNTGNWYDRGNGGFTASSVTTVAAQSVYGPFTLGSISPLPIELVKFDATYNGKSVDLKWITASEKNNDYFTVERTKNGNDFLTITKVPGAGTSTSAHYYSANDETPQNGISFYRLMQTDFDGQSSFSKLIAVRINEDDLGIDYLYPNQHSGEVYFSIKSISGNMKADVVDVLGRIVVSQKLFSSGENEIFKINAELLKTGLYTLRISNNDMVINKKFFY
ncbi:MAG: T9SS type A sorting domain-containing protein, partial [Bacteroidota bacterium]